MLLNARDIERNPGPGNENPLSIMHLNIRSNRHKLHFITDYLTDMEILCFSETHLDINVPTESLLLSNTYCEPYRKDRNNFGGGLLMYINSNLVHSRKPDLEIFCPESIWAEIKTKDETYLIGLFYSPVTAPILTFLIALIGILRKLLILLIT